MGDANPIRTLGDYSKPSHEGYRNTIELPEENNVVPLRSDAIWKDRKTSQRYLDVPTTSRRISLRSMDSFQGLTLKIPHHGIDLWLQVQIFYDHVTPATRRTIDQSAGGKLHDRNAKEFWALLEDLALYDNESWNDPRDFGKPVKAISLPQYVPSTSDRRLIELEYQVQCLMEAYIAPMQPTQVNKFTTSCEICSGPTTLSTAWKIPSKLLLNMHPRVPTKREVNDTLSNPSKAILVTPTIHHGKVTQTLGLVSNFIASQDARLSKFESDFKQQQSEITNKIDTVLKAITDRIAGALPSDIVKNPKLNVNSTSPVLSAQIRTQQPEEPKKSLEDEFKDLHLNLPVLEVLAHVLMLGNSEPFDTLADLGACVNIIPLYLFKKLNIGLLEETNHVFGLANGTKSYPIRIVRDVEVHIGRLKLLTEFYVIDMKKDPETPLLVGRGVLAIANAVIDCRKSKISVGEGITRSVFRVKGIELGAIPIKLKRNMWESEDLIKNPINWDKPPKNEDWAWHAKIRLIDPDGEEFIKTLQSVPTSRKLFEKEDPREIIDLDHFYDTFISNRDVYDARLKNDTKLADVIDNGN
ncbi:MAK10-like protein [Tanacetum coccineum]